MKKILITFLYIFILISCGNDKPFNADKTVEAKQHGYLFDIMETAATGIQFSNVIRESVVMNGFNYEYLYNGAGVSVGDVNGDGLPDLYFAASLQDNQLYINQGNCRFENTSIKSGVKGGYGLHQGTTMIDINADGKLDIYICKSGIFDDPEKRKNELYVNQGNDATGIPIFKEEAKKFGLDLPHYSTQAAFLDYDRDGDLDMFLLNHNVKAQEVQENMETLRFKKSELTSDRLFQNENGIFKDVSDKAGMINNGIGFGLGVAIGDLNNDGWADILVGQDYTEKDRLYLNQQNGTFKEIMNTATGHISTFSMGNDISDFNNDGWLDFITVDMVSEDNYGIKASMSGMNPDQFNFLVEEGFHHQYMYNTLQLNNGIPDAKGNPVFSDIASFTGISSTDWSWGPLFFDMDNDGDKDLFVSNGIKRDFRNVDYLLYKKEREKAYREESQKVSAALKGMLREKYVNEMLRNMPPRKKDNYFYENKGGLTFSKKNKEWAAEKLTATNGAAYADLDNDGDLDIITNNMDATAFIYRNNSSELDLGNYLKIQLNGSSKNPDGIGSKIKITTPAGIQIVEQYLSRGFQSSIDRILHFGLGESTTISELQIIWTNGKTQILTDIKSNQTLTLNYGDAAKNNSQEIASQQLFEDGTKATALNHFAKENEFDDYKRESLLPHKMSEEGPALAVGDVNKDGLEDFFIGGAKGIAGALYLQNSNGKFAKANPTTFNKEKDFEDVDATFFDADQDGDLDLFVVSGGNEYPINSKYYADRLYLNHNGNFTKSTNKELEQFAYSGSVVRPHDFDKDGDLDLFIGGRQMPGKYPYSGTSVLWKNDTNNEQVKFTKVDNKALEEIGMVTDAKWIDLNGDQKAELVLLGEWMPITILDVAKDGGIQPSTVDIQHSKGWWFSLESADFDNDGDMDLVAGNLGLNSKYKTSKAEPFRVYAKDFDETGTLDIVLGFHQEGKLFPLRGRECSSNQMPFIKEKFPNYHSFASAELEEVYGTENINAALGYEVSTFASTYFENNGNGVFIAKPLPNLAQISTIKKIIPKDINQDGYLDLILLENMYGFEVETPKQDAGYGLYLVGDGKGNFTPMMPFESGLFVKGEVANAEMIQLSNQQDALVVAKNQDFMQLIKIGNQQGESGL